MSVADGGRVALMHSNADLATQLSKAVDRYCPGWTADPYAAVVDYQTYTEKLDRVQKVWRGDYDLIQADELVGNGPAAQALATTTSTPVVGYLRGWGDYTNAHSQYEWRKRNRIRAKAAVLMHSMDGMAAISSATIGGMERMYSVGGCDVIERPYDIEYYSSGSSGTFDRPTILTTTNLRYQQKYDGVLTAMDGLRPVLDEYEEWQYAIAGDGRHLEALRERVHEYPYRDQVQVLGFRDDVPDLLASADLFVYVSFLDGAPSTVYEAQIAGLPIIGGDAAGVPEAVGDAGLVCPPTPRGVSESVRTLLSDESKREALARASTEKMATHNERVAREWTRFWGEVL